ncbi:MAG: hypothetical protein R3E42_02545 [Burkholderiaceae bacterium]
MKRSLISSLRLTLSAFLVFSTLAPAAWAQGFAAYISPPRFEIRTQPGESLREVVEIQHVGREKGSYRLYTDDWTMGPDNGVAFTDALAPDSCRPWVAIERRELTLEPGARYRYRFQIDVPAGTAPRECRFALMVEGLDPAEGQGRPQLSREWAHWRHRLCPHRRSQAQPGHRGTAGSPPSMANPLPRLTSETQATPPAVSRAFWTPPMPTANPWS